MNAQALTAALKRQPYPSALLLFLAAAFVLFANTFGHPWIYDDFPVIVDNPDVRSWANFLADGYPGRPLRELTYLLDHALFGLKPAGWRIQQIFWHGLNAFLLFALVRRLTAKTGVAILAGLLFLAHPLTVEVVANLSHRKDSLALAFILLTVHAWLQGVRSAGARRWGWLGAATALWGVALLAKENAVVVPALLLLLDGTLVPRPQRLLLRTPWAACLVGAVLVAAGIGYVVQSGGAAAYARDAQFVLSKINVFGEFSAGAYLLVLLKSWAFMLLRVVCPVDLAIEYSFSPPTGLFDPWVLGMLLLIAAGVAAAVVAVRRATPVAFGLGWFVLLFLPVANLWPGIYFAADRYLYAPLAGAAVIAAWLLGALAERWRPAAIGAAVVLVLACGVLTWRQNRVWSSDYALWSRAVAVSPDSVYALNNLGVVYGRQKDWARAVELLTRAAANPYYREAQENLARLHAWLGNAEEAALYRQRARNPHGQHP